MAAFTANCGKISKSKIQNDDSGKTMKLALCLFHEVELFELENYVEAFAAAEKSCAQVYTWETTGKANFLQKGASCVDALGLVVLPIGLPTIIEMPDDPEESEYR